MFDLKRVKAHPSYPFSDFLTNDISFLMAELYWAELFLAIVPDGPKSWVPCLQTERDGNPIFSVYDPAIGRAVRVVMKTNEESKSVYPDSEGENTYYGLQAWCNSLSAPSGAGDLEELVFFADCREESELEVRALLEAHCVSKVSTDRLEEMIQDYEKRVGMPD